MGAVEGPRVRGSEGSSRNASGEPSNPRTLESSNPSLLVTGLGAICAAGSSPEAIWSKLSTGRSALAPITQWDASGWRCRSAGEITTVDQRTLVPDRKTHKVLNREDFFGLYAARQAVTAAGLQADESESFRERTGVFVGADGGAYRNQYDFLPVLAETGSDRVAFGRTLSQVVHPMWLLRVLPNNVLCHVGITHGFTGPNACITNHSVSGAQALIEAAAALRHGSADRAVVIGHDAPVEPQRMHYYGGAGLLTDDAVRPFDATRSGCVLGEGAAALVLETRAAADARGAPVCGAYLGGGCASEGEGLLPVRADGDGLARAIEMALADARLAPDAIGMIVAHGNATGDGDASEAAALRRVFGDHVPPVTATKWAFGHLLAAAASIDVVLALSALRAGVVPGIATFTRLAADCAPLAVSSGSQRPRSDVALILCRGFGGTNAAVIVQFWSAPL